MSTESVSKEREVINVWYVKAAGPKGGRPIERPMTIDANGLRAMLEALPACDRIRLPDGEELAGHGSRDPGSVTALVPSLTSEQLSMEFLRRENMAMISDMGMVRKAAAEGTVEVMKVMRGQVDVMQAMLEKVADLTDKIAERQSGDLTDQIVESVMKQLMGGGLGGMLGRAKP